MQQFKGELTNVPRDASQVPCSTSSELNRVEKLSVSDGQNIDKLTLNNPDVDQRSTNNQDLQSKVFVLNLSGKPVMPTKRSRARKMLESGRAKLVKRFPFTIQLNFECENQVQKTSLGIDTGFGDIGFSVTTEKEELICGTLVLDGRTKDRLDERRMYRRGRRKKLWYRKPRFDNRISTKKEGWLPPSIERRYQTHLILINRLKKIISISNVILEVAKFDIQKIENPEIEGIQYQQGDLYQYQNVRSYLMAREKGLCQFCGNGFKNQSVHAHHIKPKSKGGNNRVSNLAILHEKCHDKLHNNHLENQLKSNSKSYRQSTFMNIIRKRFWKDVPNLRITYGNITFVNRNQLNLPKTHYNDAFIISGGTNQNRTKPLEIKQVHRNNRVLQLNRKGFKPSIKKEKSKVNPGDLFWIRKISYVCKGMFNYGKYILFGNLKKKEYFKFSEVTKIFHFGSFVWNI